MWAETFFPNHHAMRLNFVSMVVQGSAGRRFPGSTVSGGLSDAFFVFFGWLICPSVRVAH